MKTRFSRFASAALLGLAVATSAATWGQQNLSPGPNSSSSLGRAVAASPPSSPAPSAEIAALLEKIHSLEAQAAQLAKKLRESNSNDSAADPGMIKEWQQQLNNLLAEAFDAKLKVEELQVKELQTRLAHFERQISQRKKLRDKIIARRAIELVDQSDLDWNSATVAADTSANNSVIPQADDLLKLTTQVRFRGQDGMKILVDGLSNELITPARYNFPRQAGTSTRVTLGFSNAEGIPEHTQFYGLLDTYSANEKAEQFLKHNSVPITITDEDFQRAWDDVVIKFIYLDGKSDPPTLSTKTLFQSRITSQTKVDPDGTVLVALQITRLLERFGVPAPRKGGFGEPTWPPYVQTETPRLVRHLGIPGLTGTTASGSPEEKPKTEVTLESLRERFEPFRRQSTTLREHAREVETAYWTDRSRAEELRQALTNLNRVLGEWHRLWTEGRSDIEQQRHQLEMARTIYNAQTLRFEQIVKQFAAGELDEAQVKKASDDSKSSEELLGKQNLQMTKLDKAFNEWNPPTALDYEYITYAVAAFPQPAEDRPGVALLRLEIATGLKLELVHLDDLQLWFKTALRVRESTGKYHAGDLIVVVNGRLFDTLDQAALNLNTNQNQPWTYLLGGLAGTPMQVAMSSSVDERPSGTIEISQYRFEVQVRDQASGEVRTQYLHGTGISADGLVVIAADPKAITTTEPMLAFGDSEGTARIVGSDEKYGLILVKVQSTRPRLLNWVKCRSAMPNLDQQVRFAHNSYSAKVSEVNVALPSPLSGKEAFAIQSSNKLELGTAVAAIDQQLQGIVVSIPQPNDDAGTEKRYLLVPAAHIERMVTEFWKSIPQ